MIKIIQYETSKYWNYVFKNIDKRSAQHFESPHKNMDIPFYRYFHNNNTGQSKYERLCKEIVYRYETKMQFFANTNFF